MRKEADVDALKQSVVRDFQKFLDRLELGYVDNYDMIIHKISFIQNQDKFEHIGKVYEYLINN